MNAPDAMIEWSLINDAAESNLPETDSDGDGGRSMDTQVSLHTTGFTQR